MLRQQIGTVAKWAWVGCVLVAAGFIVVKSWDDITATLSELAWWGLVGSVLLTVAAKIFLGENARIAAERGGIEIGYVEAFRLYNLSQLGKYLPGSIWQFVARAAAYRNRGAEYASIRDALLCENLWIVMGSATLGVLFTGPAVIAIVSDSMSPLVAWWLCGAGALAVLLVAAVAFWKYHLLTRYLRLALPSVRGVLVQACIWVLLGLAFWVLARAGGLAISPVHAIGLFAVGFVLGFIVPFAPAGLGIRDAVLTVGLMPFVPAGGALAITVLARIVYLVVDLLLALGQELVLPAAGGRRQAESGPG